jgi:hypothetical protein
MIGGYMSKIRMSPKKEVVREDSEEQASLQTGARSNSEVQEELLASRNLQEDEGLTVTTRKNLE